MEKIKVQDIYNVTQISSDNNAIWETLLTIAELIDKEVEFDFKGIELITPWENRKFREFLADKKVYIKVYNSEELVKTLDFMREISNIEIPQGKIKNIVNIIEGVEVEEGDVNLINKKEKILQAILYKNNIGHINMENIVSQLSSINTIEALRLAIQEINKETGIISFRVELGSMFVQENIIEYLAKIYLELLENGIYLEISTTDSQISESIFLYQQYFKSLRMTTINKITTVYNTLIPYTVGLLSRFKKSRRKDKFGRQGDGIPIECRVALYLGMSEKGEVIFKTFKTSTFTTKRQYYLDNDGAELKGLEYNIISTPIETVGFYDKFLGELYHFDKPIQYNLDDSIIINEISDSGQIKVRKITIPEFIYLVLEDHKERYNKPGLLESIRATKNNLKKAGYTNG